MPTVLVVQGWRTFFHSNEGDQPIHVHAVKSDAECMFWLYPDQFVIEEEFEHNLRPRLRREIRRIVYQHFDEICEAWREHFGSSRAY